MSRRAIPLSVRRAVLERHGERCYYCGETLMPLQIDHVVPYSKGGTDDVANLVPACGTCNFEKLDWTPAEWRTWREEKGYGWPPESRTALFARLVHEAWMDESSGPIQTEGRS